MEETQLADHLLASPSLAGRLSPLARRRPAVLTCPAAYEGDSTIPTIPTSHYVFDADREYRHRNRTRKFSWFLRDASTSLREPWVASPEFQFGSPLPDDSPHFYGFNQASAHGDAW
jgi:hypothetical protein